MSGLLGRLLHPLIRRLETVGHPLRYLFIEITQRCNLDCLHCGSDCGREAQRSELSTEEWLRLLEYVARSFDRERLLIAVTGGEPFCAPGFDRILEGLRVNRLAWGMVTNGWALTEANVERVRTAGIKSVTVSLDGLADSHDWLRGRRGSFERSVAGIQRFVRARLPFFDVVTCVNPRNLDELPGLLELLRGLGVPAWRLFSIIPKGRAKANSELLLSEAQIVRMFEFIHQARVATRGSGFSVGFSCEGYLPPALDAQVRDEPYFCRAGISIASVLCDGAISACPNISRSFVQGNIRTDDLLTVWETRFGQLRNREWMRTGRCAHCRDFGRCQGNSLHLWDDEAKVTVHCYRDAVAGHALGPKPGT